MIKITDWNCEEVLFTPDRSTIHDLVLGDSVIFMVDTWASARCLTFDDVNLHVLNLNPH